MEPSPSEPESPLFQTGFQRYCGSTASCQDTLQPITL